MAEKKYYWLKMTDQFFEDKAIKKLRKIAGGDTYTIIYLKMLLTAIKQGNKMYFEGIEDDFMEELALELDEDTDNVKVTVTLMLEHKIRPTKKPDWDNVGKIICDSLNNIAYHDDNQVVDAQVRKFFSENPRVEVTIRKVEG